MTISLDQLFSQEPFSSLPLAEAKEMESLEFPTLEESPACRGELDQKRPFFACKIKLTSPESKETVGKVILIVVKKYLPSLKRYAFVHTFITPKRDSLLKGLPLFQANTEITEKEAAKLTKLFNGKKVFLQFNGETKNAKLIRQKTKMNQECNDVNGNEL